jgi:TM2 domain-containing membrane protein YozV
MAEFSVFEQQQLMSGLTDNQKMVFQAQYQSVRKDRTMVLVLSLLFGCLGVDRFLLGEVGTGLLKLFTFGGCGIWAVIDWFRIMGKTDRYNRSKAVEILTQIKTFQNVATAA